MKTLSMMPMPAGHEHSLRHSTQLIVMILFLFSISIVIVTITINIIIIRIIIIILITIIVELASARRDSERLDDIRAFAAQEAGCRSLADTKPVKYRKEGSGV